GAEGELCYFGPGMMTGYYNNPEATAEVLREHADGRVWLHTGDIVQLDDGMICFRSRHKRMIKVNGYNVYPSLIEDVIIEHPSVKQVCAVATPYKDDRRIKLFVVPEEGANLETLEADLIAYAADKVNRWSVPKKVEVIDAMPLTKMNKVDYMALQEQEMAGKSA
ncbi:MAG: acyl--CoA ligase, partial [Methanocorpusculaceae archaeon]|nr:acyl--CoA ligase [Methanocorpusculaceae archaeon]